MPTFVDRALSPDFTFREHFYANDAVADASLGQNGWEIVTIANASTYAYLATTDLEGGNFIGALRDTTDSTADGDGSVLRMFTDGLVIRPGVAMSWRWRYPTITGNVLAANNVRIGLQDSVTATDPTVGIYMKSLAGVITLHVDSADAGDNSVTVTGHPDLTSGTTAVIDTWYKAGFVASGKANPVGGPDEIRFFFNSESYVVPCLIDDDEEVEISIAHWQSTSGTLDVEYDYINLFYPHPAGRGA